MRSSARLAKTSKAAARAFLPAETGAFAGACTAIANEVADGSGFVTIRSLLSRFNAQLVVRPLLVEGMLGKQPGKHHEWMVLVDSERYKLTQIDIEEETFTRPLPSRLRFTVAHELAHSLAFRCSEFGIRLRNPIDTKEARHAVVRSIEGITDRLTTLLLVSEAALRRFFLVDAVRTSATDFSVLGRLAGVSRRALISRLRALTSPELDAFSRYSLNNVALAIAEWTERGAVIRNWPLFARFERNILPAFLLNLVADRVPAAQALLEPSFAPCGGSLNEIETTLRAGTLTSPHAESMKVHCSIESTARSVGTEFFMAVRRTPLTIPVQASQQ